MEKTYYIFDQQTDDFIGEVLAISIADAEYIACGTFLDHGAFDMYALSADSF
ncbi:MAG: hypothetical protein J6W84_03555 [Bacteroidales bacterium]|nr:hypothetical protein [Bacteroidales bacterium]